MATGACGGIPVPKIGVLGILAYISAIFGQDLGDFCPKWDANQVGRRHIGLLLLMATGAHGGISCPKSMRLGFWPIFWPSLAYILTILAKWDVSQVRK